ncbi:MAG: hypothetical protein IJ231_02455 [Clostridia bacterium]|nr:hypothetical protein [Clostridia bacterium]
MQKQPSFSPRRGPRLFRADLAPLWAWSAALALLCTLISYPGIWYSDSFVRVTTGGAVLNAVVKALTGHRIVVETFNAFSVIPSFFMAASLGLTGHVALYTFAQAFAFFAALFLLIRELDPPYRRAQSVLYALSPVFYGASVYYEANIGSLVGLIALVLLFRRAGEEQTRGERAASFLLVALASFVTFGYRANALTVIPVLAVYLFRTRRGWARRGLPLLAMAFGLLMVKLVPWAFGVQSLSNGATGFVWEMVTAIQRLDPAEQAEYQDYLDDVFGEGATRAVLATSTEVSANDFMWGEAINAGKMSAPGVMGRVTGKYLRLLREKPLALLGVKLDFVRRAMGIGETLDDSEYDYNRWNGMGEYGFNDSLQRRAFHASYLRAHDVFGFYTRHPWLPFLVTLAMVLTEHFRKSRKRGLYALLLWLAVFYYGAYLAVIVGFELRFFYPALFLLLTLDGAILLEWIGLGVRRLRK